MQYIGIRNVRIVESWRTDEWVELAVDSRGADLVFLCYCHS